MDQEHDNSHGWTTEKATGEDVFYIKLGEEMVKRNLPFLNEVLRQLLTTSIALMGGSIVFLTDQYCDRNMKLAASAMFLLSMISALVGVLPKRDFVKMKNPIAIKNSFRFAVQWKYGWVCGASAFVFLGMILAFTGVLLK